MLFSREWLADYVDLPDAEEVAGRLTDMGHAVDAVEPRGDDVVFDVDVTTNRPDCMCHHGLARELAVALGRELRTPNGTFNEALEAADEAAAIRVDDHADCPSFTATVIRGVRVGPSPEWLVERLDAVGVRTINNVVDVTNYVLWETGQPLHAYDLRRLVGAEDGPPLLRVRRAEDGETVVTLDGETRTLDPEILVIADDERAVGLAGVMGGTDTEVGPDTVDVVLEAAHFSRSLVRRCAGRFGLHTDASHRFERGADPLACTWAARRAAALIVELAGGQVLQGELQATDLDDAWPPQVELDLEKLCRFGGIELAAEQIEAILAGLGFGLERLDDDVIDGLGGASHTERWRVTVPSWRWYDFASAHAQDVYEEVLQAVGFDAIEATLPAIAGLDAIPSPAHRRRRLTQDALAATGLAEAINYAFLDRERDAAFPALIDREPLALANPLSDRYAVLRRSILAPLAVAADHNLRHGAPAVRLFEIGHVFAADDGDGTPPPVGVPNQRPIDGRGRTSAFDRPPGAEREALAVVLGGDVDTPWQRGGRDDASLDFFDLKGVLETLFDTLGAEVGWRPADVRRMVPGTGAELILRGGDIDERAMVIGVAGQLDEPDAAVALFGAEILLDALPTGERALETTAPSRFPGIEADTTLTHPLDVAYADIAREIDAADVPHLVSFELRDRYRGDGVPAGSVATTIGFRYAAEDRSLTQDEVNDAHQALSSRLEAHFASGEGDM
ncbi:MAG: phenylalanine--tRNA ligase subunit beta [Acidobacteriota bacterium]